MPDSATELNPNRNVDLVFQGGGVMGIALVGALAVLEERGFKPQNLAGTSAGALVATLRAAGYSGEELRRVIAGTDFRRFLDTDWEDRIPLIGTPLSLLKDQGIYEGKVLRERLRELLAQADPPVHTFRDLVHPDYADQPRYRYRVQVVAADISARRLLVLPQDAEQLGIAPDDLEVALAVRMSAGIPIFFEPVRWPNPKTGREHVIVDGGLLSNFPVWLFDSPGVPAWPTFGLRLVQPEPDEDGGGADNGGLLPSLRGIEAIDFACRLIQTMLEAHDKVYIDQATFARTIAIQTGAVHATDFTLSPEQAESLYQVGRAAATAFLKDWDFAAYIAEFRSSQEHAIRQTHAELLEERAAQT